MSTKALLMAELSSVNSQLANAEGLLENLSAEKNQLMDDITSLEAQVSNLVLEVEHMEENMRVKVQVMLLKRTSERLFNKVKDLKERN